MKLAEQVALSEFAKSNGIGELFVRVVSARGMLAMQKILRDAPDGDSERILAPQLSAFSFNEEGSRLWPTVDDALAALDKLTSQDVRQIIEMATRLNGMSDEAVEETAKN